MTESNDSTPAADTATDTVQPKALKGLSVPELRERYQEVMGRETTSHDKRYLVWKLRQVERGFINPKPGGGRAPGVPHKVIPLRLPEADIDAIDTIWRRHNIKSRTEFFRQAIAARLRELGEAPLVTEATGQE